jgi:hypothetical protein
MKYLLVLIAILFLAGADGCTPAPTSDEIQAKQAETILKEGTAQTGMPAIKNFRERKTLKMIYELRDQEGLSTYTYIVSEQTGKPVFLCNSTGFAISDATGYLSPDKLVSFGSRGSEVMFQAEPNGLFTPDASNANWVTCLESVTGKPLPVFVSADILVSAFKLP